MTFQDFINQNNNQGLDFDGYYGDQCVDLAQFYNRDVLGNGVRFTGNATDIYGQQPDKFDWIANTPEGVPANGDIVIWDGTLNGGPGHIAIFIQGDSNKFESFDQNWPTGSVCHVQHHSNYSYIKGWGRPKINKPNKPQEETMTPDEVKGLFIAILGRPADNIDVGSWTGQSFHVFLSDVLTGSEYKDHQDKINQALGQVPQLQNQINDLQAQVKDLQSKTPSLDNFTVGQLLSAGFKKLLNLK